MIFSPVRCLAVLAAAYALGNINPSILLGRIYHVDVRKEGSGNAGMTNTMRVIGPKAGIIVLAVDVLKAVIAVRLGIAFAGLYGGMAGFIGVIAGHCYPALWGFRGGKGVASALGAALAFNWPSALIALAAAAVLFLISRRVSVASIGAVALYPLILYHFEPQCLYFGILIATFIIIKHHANIGRLIRGEEPPLTFGKRENKNKE